MSNAKQSRDVQNELLSGRVRSLTGLTETTQDFFWQVTANKELQSARPKSPWLQRTDHRVYTRTNRQTHLQPCRRMQKCRSDRWCFWLRRPVTCRCCWHHCSVSSTSWGKREAISRACCAQMALLVSDLKFYTIIPSSHVTYTARRSINAECRAAGVVS